MDGDEAVSEAVHGRRGVGEAVAHVLVVLVVLAVVRRGDERANQTTRFLGRRANWTMAGRARASEQSEGIWNMAAAVGVVVVGISSRMTGSLAG